MKTEAAVVTGARTQIFAPFSGILRSLTDVPDPAFAQGMVGEGIAIDPLDETVRAPCDATVIAVAPTGHSVTLRTAEGVELLIHVGIDTVRLAGAGFTMLARVDQAVATGDPLIRLDADLIAARATSLITPILVSGNGCLSALARTEGAIRAGDPLMEVAAATAGTAHAHGETESTAHIAVPLALPHGLHARPAARIAALARDFDGQVRIGCNGKSADAISTTALMGLDARDGDELDLRASGRNAREIVVAIAELLAALADHERAAAAQEAQDRGPVAQRRDAPASSARIPAVPASPGLAIGPVHHLTRAEIAVPETGADVATEQAALAHALEAVAAQLARPGASATAAEIAQAHLAIVEDGDLRAAANAAIDRGASAGAAWRQASRAQEARFQAADSARMRERAIDLRDVERRLLAHITGTQLADAALPPKGAIVVAEELEPSFLIDLPDGQIAGVCTVHGGTTSHAAILAAAAGIPMLVAAGERVARIADGTLAVLDADNGWIEPDPVSETQAWCREELTARGADRADALAGAAAPATLSDGIRIEVFANLASVADAHVAVENGAEGCGLLRTEFLFAEADSAPDEESQRETYAAIASALGDRPLIIRTIDIGGDKPIAYLPFPHEANPALGMRGIRFALQSPDLMRTQLRAMLRGVGAKQLRIMLPMVVESDEIEAVRAMVRAERDTLGIDAPVEVGIMVETPAAVLLADQLAEQADFLSIGSNDLAQYVLAMDRGNSTLVSRVDAHHPAVIQSIAITAKAAHRHLRWLGICGGLASEPKAAPLLVGLGCNELSAVPRAIPEIKRVLSRWKLEECQALAARALKARSTEAVRRLLAEEAR